MKISKKLIIINIMLLLLVILLVIRLLMYANLTNKLNNNEANSYKYHCLVQEVESKDMDVLISTLRVYNDITVDSNYVITDLKEYYIDSFKQEEIYNDSKNNISDKSNEVREYIFNDNDLTIRTNEKVNTGRFENIANSKVWIEDYLSNYSNPVCERVSTYE